MFVEIVCKTSGAIVKRMGPFDARMAYRVESGALINLNHEEYFTRVTEE